MNKCFKVSYLHLVHYFSWNVQVSKKLRKSSKNGPFLTPFSVFFPHWYYIRPSVVVGIDFFCVSLCFVVRWYDELAILNDTSSQIEKWTHWLLKLIFNFIGMLGKVHYPVESFYCYDWALLLFFRRKFYHHWIFTGRNVADIWWWVIIIPRTKNYLGK